LIFQLLDELVVFPEVLAEGFDVYLEFFVLCLKAFEFIEDLFLVYAE
jgi:hypothetical protein